VKSKLEIVLERIAPYGVEFLVIGGQAASIYGCPIPTYDVDLCYRRTAENLERLAKALIELHPTLRGAPPDLPFQMDAKSLALGSNFTFNTDVGSLDLLGWVEPFGGYDELVARSESQQVGEHAVRVISLDDLIKIKRHIRRDKDQAALFQLEAIKKMRDQAK
jgi:predicted nucleotidyltransferase